MTSETEVAEQPAQPPGHDARAFKTRDESPGRLQRMVRHGSRRTRPRRPDHRIPAPAATAARPGHAAAQPDWPRDGRASAARPVGHSHRPPLPTTPTPRPSSLADSYMSATENRRPVGGGMSNTPLSSRLTRENALSLEEPSIVWPICWSKWFGVLILNVTCYLPGRRRKR